MRATRSTWIICLTLSASGCTGELGTPGDDQVTPGTSGNGPAAGDGTTSGSSGSSSTKGGNGSTSGGSGSTNGGSTGGTGTATGGAASQTGGAPVAPPVDATGRYVCNDKTYGGPSQVRRLTLPEYQNVITDVLGVAPGTLYPASYGKPASGFSTEPGINTIAEQGVEQLMNSAEAVAELLPAALSKILPCAATKADAACAGTFLDTVGRRAFRRTLAADEKTNLLAVYTAETADGAKFADAVSVMTAQMLQMPAFVYLIEQPSTKGVDRALTGLELASRLSFHLWNSAPDDALLTSAESGKLTSKDAVLVEAKRLFADAKSDRGFTRFFREWIDTPNLSTSSKDAKAFTYFNAAFVTSVNQSFDRFVVDQVRSSKTLYDVFRTNAAFVDKNLASFFGLPTVSAWTPVTLPADRYTGIMTQPAVMAALAHTVEPAFIFRGRTFRKRLLCQPIGAPPPDAMAQFAKLTKPADPTARDVAKVIEAQAACTGCHSLLDPAGLAFEHFDGMGAYREAYASGKAIDSTGTLTGVGTANVPFTGPTDLMEALAESEQSKHCFATQMVRYAASRMDDAGDVCAIQAVQDAMIAADGKVSEAFLASTQTDLFLYRRGE